MGNSQRKANKVKLKNIHRKDVVGYVDDTQREPEVGHTGGAGYSGRREAEPHDVIDDNYSIIHPDHDRDRDVVAAKKTPHDKPKCVNMPRPKALGEFDASSSSRDKDVDAAKKTPHDKPKCVNMPRPKASGEFDASSSSRDKDPNAWEGVAIFDFCATEPEDLSLKKGDRVKVTSGKSNEDSWRIAQNITSKQVGYVPRNHVAESGSLFVHDWYHGNISAVEARLMLTSPGNPIGSYLVRGEQGLYELMILTLEEGGRKRIARNYAIEQLGDEIYSIAPLECKFFHIPELINFCKVERNTKLCQRLGKPCPKSHPAPTDLSTKYRTTLDLPSQHLRKEQKLGKGNFASVWLGFWKDTTKVAIKQAKDRRWYRHELMRTLEKMKTLRHPNIVRLYGVAQCEAPPLLLVTELMDFGNLRDYMRSEQAASLSYGHLLNIGKQIACGMAYIEDKGVTHRDLAAKNVLVGVNNTVKICDVGMICAVEDSYVKAGGIFPVRWSAPEVMHYRTYSIKSDVWAYAVVLVEITTHGQLPYSGLSNATVEFHIPIGMMHEQPAECSDDLYSIMKCCWHIKPQDRPSFRDLADKMASLQDCENKNTLRSSTVYPTSLVDPGQDPAKKIVMAMHNFSALEGKELSFMKGDKLEILTKDQWHKARHLGTGKEGYIPSNYVTEDTTTMIYDWYHPDINRIEAEQLLKLTSTAEGAFLIRKSSSDGFSLSLLVEKVGPVSIIKHYKIEEALDGLIFISRSFKFADLKSLVKHYSEDGGLACQLGMACPKPRPAVPGFNVKKIIDTFEIDRKELQIETKLAAGHFGEVWTGLAKGAIPVAIKKAKPATMTQTAFLKEAAIMKKLDHPNIVRLYGVCSDEPIYIVTEFVENGSLLEFLREDQGPKFRIPLVSLVYMTQQVANGMIYLEERNYIHRDLAARNILVSTHYVVKIADFGMARAIPEDVYVTKQVALPVKWTAPEALIHLRFSVKSDVWSFGIVMVEVITRGGVPYPGMSNEGVGIKVQRREHHIQPYGCPDDIYKIMKLCWKFDPADRPSFVQLETCIEQFLFAESQKDVYEPPLTE